jgi:hypothetical protein
MNNFYSVAMKKTRISTSDVLEGVVERVDTDLVTLSDLKDILHERSFCLLMVLFSFPIAVPLPYPPGFTTILGAPVLLFAYQMMMGWDAPWLPAWIGKKSIKRTTLASFIEKSAPYLRRYERISKPRLSWFCTHRAERMIGFLAFLCAISVVLPIPLGNAIPSAGILVMMMGLLTRDGLVVLLGILLSIVGVVISVAVVIGSASIIAYFAKKVGVFFGLKIASGG